MFHDGSARGIAEGVEDTVDIGFLFRHRPGSGSGVR
jgi:hypothetical protein